MEPPRSRTLGDLLDEMAARYPEGEAVVFEGDRLTYEEYRSRVAKVQSEMAKRGIDVLMINHLENIYYLSGYRTIGYYSFMALFVPPSGDPVHLSRLIERTVLQGSSWVDDMDLYPDTELGLDAAELQNLSRAGVI